MKARGWIILGVTVLLAVPAAAQTVTVDDLACVPLQPHDDNKNHALVTAEVEPDQAGHEVRLYFRRLDPEVEDFYYSVMQAEGNGDYWGVLPDPEDQALRRDDPAWWNAKEAADDRDPDGDLDAAVIRERAQVGRQERRDWLEAMSEADLRLWLADQKSEPVEYFVAVYNPAGTRVAQSEMKIASVREDCRVQLTTEQIGEAHNQTIGETAAWQNNLALYHWECDHIVTRINYSGVKEEDAVCRACVVATIPFWIPSTAAASGLAGIVLCTSETGTCEEEGSPSEP